MMSSAKSVFLAALVTCLAVPIGHVVAANPPAPPHKVCADCHETDNKLKTANVNELCLSCHPANVTDHKIGVVPKITPAGLPLDKDNKMTCITCHDPHGKGSWPKFLRMKTDDICLSCHQK